MEMQAEPTSYLWVNEDLGMGNGEVGKGDVSSTWWGRQGLLQAPHPINSTVWLGEGFSSFSAAGTGSEQL